MTSEEFKPLMVRVEAWWPGTRWDEAMIAVWFEELGRFPAESVCAVFERLKREHTQPFAPSVGEVLRLLERGDPAEVPTFDEAFQLIFRSRGVLFARPKYGQSEHGAMMERASGMHPLIASFVERQGLSRLRLLPIDDPEFGDVRRRELRESWDRHVEAFEGREVAAIASGSGDLRQLDPLAHLPEIGGGS